MSSGNCETFPSETNVPEMVRVTRVSVLIEMDDSGNSDEEPGVLDVLDSVKRDHFDRIGVASGGKGSLLVVLRVFSANDRVRVDVPPRLLINFIIKKEINKKG